MRSGSRASLPRKVRSSTEVCTAGIAAVSASGSPCWLLLSYSVVAQSIRERGRMRNERRAALRLGPGLITGACNNDPSSVGTYSQVGAQFGFGLAWTLLFSFPLLVAIQEISARIARVTGCGIAGNLRR